MRLKEKEKRGAVQSPLVHVRTFLQGKEGNKVLTEAQQPAQLLGQIPLIKFVWFDTEKAECLKRGSFQYGKDTEKYLISLLIFIVHMREQPLAQCKQSTWQQLNISFKERILCVSPALHEASRKYMDARSRPWIFWDNNVINKNEIFPPKGINKRHYVNEHRGKPI